MNTLSCFDQDSKLEHFLSDTDKRFRNIVIEGDILKIHVDGTWSSTDRIALQTDIEDNFPELREVSIIIVDKYDRLQESDKRRRDLEQQVQNEVRVLVEKSEIGANDIDHVKLRFTLLSRLLRWMWFNGQSVVIKVDADPDKIKLVRAALSTLAKNHALPLTVRWTSLLTAARDEMRIEKGSHHL